MRSFEVNNLSIFESDRGDLLKGFLKSQNDGFNVQEVYFSEIFGGETKGWKKHTIMTCNMIVPVGKVEVVIVTSDENSYFHSEIISKDNYKKNTYTSSRVISLSNPKVRHLELTVNTSISPDLEKVVILDKEFYLLKIIENIENNQIKWKYSNYYWVDPNDGVVWKSIQKIAPNVPEIKLEITKQPDL